MSEKEFYDRLKENPRPVVVDFWAPWCGPCRAIEPIMKKLGAEYDQRVDVWRINADEHPDLLRSLNIFGIPTLVAYHQGQEVARHTGAGSTGALANLFVAASTGARPVKAQRAPLDRLLRLGLGTAMFFVAYEGGFSGFYLFLAGLAAVVAFSAIYDRCPVYRAVSAHLSAWVRKVLMKQAGS